MRNTHLTRLALFVPAAAALTLIAGCPASDPRTSNQGGGSVVTAGLKIANSQISQLTPDELQILTDEAAARNAELNGFELSDEAAADAVAFLEENDLNSVADIEAFVEQAEQNPSSIEIPDSIQEIIDSGAFQVAPPVESTGQNRAGA